MVTVTRTGAPFIRLHPPWRRPVPTRSMWGLYTVFSMARGGRPRCTREVMTTSCKYCGRTHPVGVVCEKKPVRPRYDQAWSDKHRGDPERVFRSSNAWRAKADQIRARDYHLCRVCLDGAFGAYTTPGIPCRLHVHHIRPVAQGWDDRLEDGNLITLCVRHHAEADDGKIPAGYLSRLAYIPPVFNRE